MKAVIRAQFRATCRACGEAIVPGQLITKAFKHGSHRGHVWVHDGCTPDVTAAELAERDLDRQLRHKWPSSAWRQNPAPCVQGEPATWRVYRYENGEPDWPPDDGYNDGIDNAGYVSH